MLERVRGLCPEDSAAEVTTILSDPENGLEVGRDRPMNWLTLAPQGSDLHGHWRLSGECELGESGQASRRVWAGSSPQVDTVESPPKSLPDGS